MTKDNHLLLMNWLYKTIADNPDAITKAEDSIDVYRMLQHKFLQDMQIGMKKIAKEVLLIAKQ